MDERLTSYEKGLALEQRLARLFEAKGYVVIHNTVRIGRSGAEHQLDLLVSFRCPLHTSTVIVEAKSYQAAVDKDRIMKLTQIVDDLGADRGVIVTTSYFTPAALKTAEGHNVELWDHDKLATLLGEVERSAVETGLPKHVEVIERVVRPSVTVDDVRVTVQRELDKRARGFLGIGKVVEDIDAILLVYYPYYEAALEIQVTERERVGLTKKSVRKVTSTSVTFDAAIGSLVSVGPLGVSYDFSYLRNLTADEVTLLRVVAGRTFSLNVLMALGFSEGKARKVLSSLEGKGAIERLRTRPVSFSCKRSFPADPRSLRPISETYPIEETAESQGVKYRGELKEPNAVIRASELYWPGAVVRGFSVVYYPYVVAALARVDGSTRTVVIDAMTGRPNGELERHRWEIAKA